jgi:hypothetical protein
MPGLLIFIYSWVSNSIMNYVVMHYFYKPAKIIILCFFAVNFVALTNTLMMKVDIIFVAIIGAILLLALPFVLYIVSWDKKFSIS